MGEVLFYEPGKWFEEGGYDKKVGIFDLHRGDRVYFLCEIPNVPGHCLVIKHQNPSGFGFVQCMHHPGDFRKATEEEL